MAINFPDSPVNGTTYVYQDIKYIYKDTGGGLGYWAHSDVGTATEATTTEIDTGVVTDKFVSPAGLDGSKFDKTYSSSYTSNSSTTIATSKAVYDGVASAISSSISPTGTVVAFAGSTLPSGWLWCNGSSIPTTYTALRAIVGPNTPDLRDMFIRGKGNSRTLLSEQSDSYKDHHHIAGIMSQHYPTFDNAAWGTFPSESFSSKGGSTNKTYDGSVLKWGYHQEHHQNQGNTHYPLTSGAGEKTGKTTFSKSGSGSETRPVNMALNYIIKT